MDSSRLVRTLRGDNMAGWAGWQLDRFLWPVHSSQFANHKSQTTGVSSTTTLGT